MTTQIAVAATRLADDQQPLTPGRRQGLRAAAAIAAEIRNVNINGSVTTLCEQLNQTTQFLNGRFAIRSSQRRLLVTGFGPFQAVVENPSSLIAQAVDGQRFSDVEVTGRKIDVSWSRAFAQVQTLVNELAPDALVCFGVARSPQFRLEVMARNVASNSEDAFGECFESGPLGQIVNDAPAAFFSTLPLEFLLQELSSRREQSTERDSTLSGALSHDAGQYLCNYLFFRVMNELESVPVRGFIHVPPRVSVDGSSHDEVIDAGGFLVRQVAAWLAESVDE